MIVDSSPIVDGPDDVLLRFRRELGEHRRRNLLGQRAEDAHGADGGELLHPRGDVHGVVGQQVLLDQLVLMRADQLVELGNLLHFHFYNLLHCRKAIKTDKSRNTNKQRVSLRAEP